MKELEEMETSTMPGVVSITHDTYFLVLCQERRCRTQRRYIIAETVSFVWQRMNVSIKLCRRTTTYVFQSCILSKDMIYDISLKIGENKHAIYREKKHPEPRVSMLRIGSINNKRDSLICENFRLYRFSGIPFHVL